MQLEDFECDPWREEYFTRFTGSADVHIPTDDTAASNSHPEHRWIYNKLLVAQSQGIECGGHDVEPAHYPVFCKPAMNLSGADSGGSILYGERDYRENCRSGDFWMKVLTGEPVSTDFAVVKGETAWCRHASGIPRDTGTFGYWVVEEHTRPRLVKYCKEWIRAHLAGYTGMVNMETIGARIIAIHLRFADQWPDLYGRKWLDALVRLHQRETWDLVDSERAEGYSVVLFGSPGSSYERPKPGSLAAYRATMGISSIKVASRECRPLDEHATPPGGCRLAVINSFNLAEGLRVGAAMARDFGLQGSGNPKRFAG